MNRSGLRGRGGAGFPTGRKWRMIADASGPVKYVICNADDSEPATFKDRGLMDADPHLLLEGVALAAYAVGAGRTTWRPSAGWPGRWTRLPCAAWAGRRRGRSKAP